MDRMYMYEGVVYDTDKPHPFINRAGQIDCAGCGLTKDHFNHIQSSQSVDSYRKPIAYRFDLIPMLSLRRVAAIYEEGAKVYGESKYISSPMRYSNVVNHLINHLNLYISGDISEDHLAKVVWACNTLMVYTEKGIGDNDITDYGVIPHDSVK